LFGAPVGVFGRFLAHFASGVWFFAEYAPTGVSPILYSASYNGGYLIVELIISEIIIAVLVSRRLLYIYT
jgi:thiamine transporter